MPTSSDGLQGYLVDIETGEEIEFTFNPSSISDGKDVSYAVIKIAGRSNPFVQWSSSDERKVSFTLDFYRLRDDGEVDRYVRWIESLQYPEHDAEGYLLAAPHRVLFLFGPRYTGAQKWVVESAKTTFHGLWTPELRPLYASVSLTLLQWQEDNINYTDIRG